MFEQPTREAAKDSLSFFGPLDQEPSPSKQKRNVLRPLRDCPTDFAFHASYCEKTINDRSFTVVCGEIGHRQRSHGECSARELCVQGLTAPTTAYCLSLFHLGASMTIGPGNTESTIMAPQAGIPSAGASTAGYTLEAIVTGRDPREPVRASVLAVTAQTPLVAKNGRALWGSLPGGSARCENCTSVGIGSIPERTERFTVNHVLPQSAVEGVVHLVSWLS